MNTATPAVAKAKKGEAKATKDTNTPQSRKRTGKEATQFKPGVSGNPGGRPALPEEMKEAFRARSIDALQTLVEIMLDKKEKAPARVRAAEVILDRAWGKPYQALQIDDTTDHSVTIKWENSEYGA